MSEKQEKRHPNPGKLEIDIATQDILDFGDLTPYEKKVKIGKETFILREASADAGAKFRNKAAHSARISPEGKLLGVDNPADSELYLVHLCLFQRVPDGTGGVKETNVPLERIKSWRYNIVKQMHDIIMDVSGLRQEEETEEVLTKRIAEDQKKLADMRNGSKEGARSHIGAHAKNSPDATVSSSV